VCAAAPGALEDREDPEEMRKLAALLEPERRNAGCRTLAGYLDRTAYLKDTDAPCQSAVSMAKLAASEAAITFSA